MAGLPPGDPQLVSMIVSHLKTQGLFDQFRRDCLADVDTKPAYLNLKQRVDNFVSNHLSNHTWSPHLNKNQLRNNIRQLVLQSGMLEQGVDRIVAQVVDPKINHIFRPQVERVVREFLSPGSCSEDPLPPLPPAETKPDMSIPEQDSSTTPAAASASDAMSILDTISSLNQEASVRSSSTTEKGRKMQSLDDPMQVVDENECDMNVAEESDSNHEGKPLEEADGALEHQISEEKTEDKHEQMEVEKEGLIEEIKMEVDESGSQEQKEEEKDKPTGKVGGKPLEEKPEEETVKSTNQAKQKARERIKEEYSLEDSDLEGLSDITVSSVHTSDLSSFEEESDDEEPLDSSEEGELLSDDEGEGAEKKHASGDTGDEGKECKPRRKAYVHKPFLYSRYYSDSDDEVTVEERRRSVAKDKEERLLKRQQNRERLEEKLKQKAAQDEEQDPKKQKISDSAGLENPKAKEARKERKVLEKKMALSRKRKLNFRKESDVSSKKKGDTGDLYKKTEAKISKTLQPKLARNLSESASSDERHRRTSGSISEDSCDTKKLPDKSRTHSFILELEQGSQEALKQRSVGKFDRLSRKEPHSKERRDKDRSLSDDRTKLKLKQEKKSEHQADESQHKESAAVKVSSEEKGEKKPKIKSEKKMAGNTREGKVTEGAAEEGGLKDVKKVKGGSVESVKAEKDKPKDKDKIKEKEKSKGEKISVKSDMKQLLRPDSAGSSEDRSDMEPGSDSTKKRDKHSKEVLKRSKSHPEDRPVDKPKSKTDSEKEKTKIDPNSQKLHKSTPDMDKEHKKVKLTEKGKIPEKSKVRPKEEAKSVLKTDKKVQSLDVKSAGAACLSKPEVTKEKRRDAKEQRRVSEEAAHEKSELKSTKKKLEKKDKVQEKKDDVQEDKTAPRVETSEKSDKSSKSSVSSPSLETEEPPKKQLLLQDTSTDSDPVTAAVTAPLSDDTCDALSDITPEPPEGETESRLSEMPAVPAEADALLTLMDVCTSAEARLPPESFREEVTPEIELCDADLKMKEAALTLLSMDPDCTISSSLICQSTREEAPAPSVVPPEPQPMETTTAEEEKQMEAAPDMELPATERSTTVPQQTTESVEENKVTADECENLEKKIDTTGIETSEMVAPQEDEATLKEQETTSDGIPVEVLPDEKTATSADGEGTDAVMLETEELSGRTEDTVAVVPDDTEHVLETPAEPDEPTEPDVSVPKTSVGETEAEGEAKQTKMDPDNGGGESKTVEEENAAVEEDGPQSMEVDVSYKSKEVEGAEPESTLVKEFSNVSNISNGEDEKSPDQSEKEEEREGSGRCEQKLSTQEDASPKESGDIRDEKGSEELQSGEVIGQENIEEGRLATDEAATGQSEESRRGTCSAAAEEEATADLQKKDESEAEDISDESSSLKAEEKETAESEPETSVQGQSEVSLPPPVPEEGGGGQNSDSQKTGEPAEEKMTSEEMEKSGLEIQSPEDLQDNSGQEKSEEHPDKESGSSPSGNQSDDVEQQSCSQKKTEEDEGEQPLEDQETTIKKRRGRPPKSAATSDPDKKDKKVEEKEGQQNDEEEDDKEATRTTTRSASRLEAERNKPSKPSTRASRQGGKDEAAAGTRGTRGQVAAKGGRKREASPPAVRTRGGQKPEEPPSKRAKR
ncbi:biorientation of chromosomes in cell division protein 1-like 1 [Cololabis saira]|uniref:biorientation of chromosomes in cell division protein 1-like 1 n=1 Tax=Cololabis saira TaxID=129043 RepID=UPI002AD4F84D|nr:biorientation of chromosomes in cell division protein 1-like 1 [Cololabis saira]